MNSRILKLRRLIDRRIFIILTIGWLLVDCNDPLFAQCNVTANSTYTEITCGECVTLSHVGSTTGNISFFEDFNSGQPTGWAFTQQASFNNPCSANGVDGTTHLWMGDQSGVPRSLETLSLNFGPAIAPAGGTICFDMLFAEQGDNSPCEGPDEPDEGVYLQYSTDGGANWITIEYFDPNGGNDPQLVNWNNWCFPIPAGALVNGVQFRWFQDADSGAEYDHWGIDNVQIIVNDPNVQYTWQHDGYTTALPGDNPTPVCPMTTTTYTVDMTTSTGNCSDNVQIVVVNPDVQVDAGADQTVCPGDCIDLAGVANVVNDPGGITTFSNNQTETFDASIFGGAAVNVNVQDLNMATVNPGSVIEVCITDLEFTGFGLPLPGVETLSLTLVCPDGTEVELVPIGGAPAGPGGFFDPSSSYQNVCFVSSGGSDLASVAPNNAIPITGTFNSSQSLSGMDGCTANGLWSIEVETSAFTGNGTFEGWSITFDDEIDQYTPDVLWSPTTYMAAGEETTLTPEVCPVATTTYTLSASDNAGCVTVTDDVTITIDPNCCDPQTPPIQGPTPLCANATGQVYSVTNTVGSTYTWTVPSGATITSGQGTNSITVDFGTTGGQITVVETINCGDGPAITFDVVLDPAQTLVISDPTAVCQPATIDLTVAAITAGSTGGGALTYWTDAGGTNALATPNAVATSGTYYIQAGTGACSDIQPVTVTINNCAGCTMTDLTFDLTDCYTSGQGFLQYDLEGTLTYTDPPATGTLTITDCFGFPQVFNPPFTGTQVFTVTGLPQDGLNCDFTAVFSDDPACTITAGFVAPPTITFFSSNCVVGSGTVDGTIEFNNPPATGTIVIEIDDGTSTQSTNIQPPFNSPEAWVVNGLDPAAANYVITYYFSDFPSCTQTQTMICGCAAEGGTTTTTMNGDGTAEFILCDGDDFQIVNNGDYTFPDDEGPIGGYAYQPAYTFLVYTCPPTAGTFPNDDPCFTGIVPSDGSMTDLNDPNSIFSLFPAGTFTNNEVWYVPITLYHYNPANNAYIVNANCWDMGTASSVTYLPEVTSVVNPDCQDNSVTVTVSGGYPAIYGGNFTASNLVPATASFVNSTSANGGDIVITGLQNGDNYSFDITDENGCPHPITGGPFVALPIAAAGSDDQTCILSYDLQAVASYGTGTWTSNPAGAVYVPSANDPNATVTVPSGGVYTFTWTEDNGNGCIDFDDVEITFSLMSIPAVITNASCGSNDGEIVVAPQGGVGPYTYSWTSGGTGAVESNLGAGNVTVTVTDNTGCSLDSTFAITQPVAFSVNVATADETCFGDCDGEAFLQPDGNGPYTYTWVPNVSIGNNPTDLCQGDYTINIADQDGCTHVETITIGGPTAINVILDSDVSEVCIGQSANLSATITGGTQPYGNFNWVADPADPTLIPTVQNPTVSPVVTTTYTLVVTDANGCTSPPKVVVIDVLPPLSLDFIRPLFSPDTGICPYDTATIDLTAAGGDGTYTFYLLPDDVNPVTLPIDTQPLVTTTFDFMVTDGCGTPPAFASSTVTIYELPVVTFIGDSLSGCDPLTVNFTDLTQPTPTQWTWGFGDPDSNSNTANVDNPIHTFSGPGAYDISLSVVSAEGCVNDTIYSSYIDVYPVPVADFYLDPEIINLLDANIDFTDISTGDLASWDWDFGDGEGAVVQNPSHLYGDTGTYTIFLEVTSVDGCTDIAQRQLIVEPDFMFYIPNAFTPNNDGRNDAFRGYGEGIKWDTYEMSIFDRWGELIYYTGDIEDPWDGTYKDKQVEMSVYVWKVRFIDINGDDHDYYGHVTLVR